MGGGPSVPRTNEHVAPLRAVPTPDLPGPASAPARFVTMPKSSIVAALVAVEVAIVAVALYAIGFGRPGAFMARAQAGIQHYDFVGKPFPAMAAGTAPHVTIDDPEST